MESKTYAILEYNFWKRTRFAQRRGPENRLKPRISMKWFALATLGFVLPEDAQVFFWENPKYLKIVSSSVHHLQSTKGPWDKETPLFSVRLEYIEQIDLVTNLRLTLWSLECRYERWIKRAKGKYNQKKWNTEEYSVGWKDWIEYQMKKLKKN